MKKNILILTALVVSSIGAFAQGQIQFNNFLSGQVRAPIYGVDPISPTISQRGNPANGIPAGTTVYGGAPLAGTGFSVQVFGGATGTAENDLAASSVILNFRTGSAAGFLDNQTLGVPATISGVLEGQTAAVQLRAWDNQGGTITSWEQAVANQLTVAQGTSAIFTSQPLGGVLTTPPPMIGLTGFNLAVVPEPSTIALGILGAGSLLFLRRKK